MPIIVGTTKLLKLSWLTVTAVLLFDSWHQQKVVCSEVTSLAFKVSTTSAGIGACAVDKPAITLSSVRSAIQCSVTCTSQGSMAAQLTGAGCNCFNFWQSSLGSAGRCDLFTSVPKCYTVLTGCTHYQNSTKTPVVSLLPGVFLDATNCSFPYTYNGQLLYQCSTNQSSFASQCDIGCFRRDRTWITCTPTTRSYLAQNGTKNVSIPTLSTPVTFRSVNSWIVIHSRVDTVYPVNQLWIKYVQGFGNSSSDGNFWLGLEYMYQLTKSSGVNYRLRIEIQADANGKWFSVEYDSFYIGSAATDYTLHMASGGSGVVGDAGDPFNDQSFAGDVYMNGMPFSARDMDNDQNRLVNCAQKYGGGWWYNNCMWCNLNADLTTGYYYWRPLTGLGLSSTYNVKTSRMMVMAI